MKRRDFVTSSTLAIGALAVQSLEALPFFSPLNDFTSKRPPLNKRTFKSETVEALISEVSKAITDNEVRWLFQNCYPNTLDTTIDFEIIDGKPDTFVITGDIDAMWLRDSTAQVWPYMPLINKDKPLRELVKGLINRQLKCILTDPYANAFYKDLTKESHWMEDQPTPVAGIHERKWEIDSLCYAVRLSSKYYELTKDTTVFDDNWQKAMDLVYNTFKTEQLKDGESPYYFIRKTTNMIDSVPLTNGRPVKAVGLISSMFRPSDDATLYPFLIPSNIFASLSLRQLHSIYKTVFSNNEKASLCETFADELDEAIQKYAISNHLNFGNIYAYEVDGFGNKVFMDDANVPSLMSLAYLKPELGASEVYKNTRAFLLSDANPYYLKGKAAEGQASPHTGKDKIWPMGIILRAMTSTSDDEIIKCITMLKATHANTGFMHEAFHKDNPNDFTRSWFAWANTLFGELIIKVYNERPSILSKTF